MLLWASFEYEPGFASYFYTEPVEQGLLRGLSTTHDEKPKGCEFESWQEGWESVFLQGQLSVLTLIHFSISFTPLLSYSQ